MTHPRLPVRDPLGIVWCRLVPSPIWRCLGATSTTEETMGHQARRIGRSLARERPSAAPKGCERSVSDCLSAQGTSHRIPVAGDSPRFRFSAFRPGWIDGASAHYSGAATASPTATAPHGGTVTTNTAATGRNRHGGQRVSEGGMVEYLGASTGGSPRASTSALDATRGDRRIFLAAQRQQAHRPRRMVTPTVRGEEEK